MSDTSPVRGQEMVILRGLPASGKSTYAKRWLAQDPDHRVRVNRDDLRMFNVAGKYSDLSQHQEETVTHLEIAMVKSAFGGLLSVIVDDTNLNAKTVKFWYSVADQFGIPVRVLDIDTPLEDCIENDAARQKKVGEEVIRRFYNRYYKKDRMPPVPEHKVSERIGAPYVADESLPECYIFDVDGTLASMHASRFPVHKVRGPFEWSRVGEDVPIPNVVKVAKRLSETTPLVIMSGRDAVCRPETEAWLSEMGIKYVSLHMRPEGSFEPDDKVKMKLFDDNVRHRYNVVGVFDDRLRVCRAWENIGLTLFRVGPIDSSF